MNARSLLLTLTAPLLGFACCGPDRAADPTATTPAPASATSAMETEPMPEKTDASPDTPSTDASMAEEVATFGGGCFWCTEAVLEQLDGVQAVTSGYTGGDVDNPTYKQICTGTTGHAEVVQVRFDPAVISYEQLLEWFFRSHDPTTLNRQGADIGTQYRSAIFFHSEADKAVAVKSKKAANASGEFRRPIVTEITKAATFYKAEEYHQNYFNLNSNAPYCRAVIWPKLLKLGLKFKK